MIRYRLYTERFPNIASITAKYFDGFTVTETIDYWHGVKEFSLVVEIFAYECEHARVEKLRAEIKSTNHQQSVGLTSEPVTVEF